MWLALLSLQSFKRETRFTSKCPPEEIIKKIEEAAKPLGFDVHKKNYKVKCIHFEISYILMGTLKPFWT